MNKRGAFTDLFLFMILAVAIVFICGIFIYLGGVANEQLHSTMDEMDIGNENTTVIIEQTMGRVNASYQALYWISVFLIVGMIISIFIGSYLVTTKPVFFIPYIFITIIAIIVSVGLSNAYEQVVLDPTLSATFSNFVGANFILSHLPLWVSVIGIVGGIIMFARMGSREGNIYQGGSIYG